ncbi:sensor histidine kinase [Bacillus sp. FJAT-26390]|uniref:sensor histidine kinase n=1 Tax=Bacillus sp. FJAT-26390 TaxID=1743142 RepID=UPI000807BB7C|nr:sensor histidine kinase [Bacillus sp. FJAT-26390]OBZ17710.1 hypothetical protein A7975_07655 [Bacillus sp. FJAT-26390]
MLKPIIKHMKRSLKWKLVALIVTILVFTVSAIGYFSYAQTLHSVSKDIDKLTNQVLIQANMNLNRFYTEYEMIFLLLGSSLEYREWLHASNNTELSSDLVRYYERIKVNYLNRVFLQYPELMSVTMYNPNGQEQTFANGYVLSLDYSVRDEPFLADSGNYDKVEFIPRIADYYLDYGNRKTDKPVLTLFKKFNNGYVKMDISLTPSQNVMDEISIADSSEAAVITEDGTVIHHSNPGNVMKRTDERIVGLLAGKSEGSINDRAREELIVFQSIERTHWKIFAVIPYEKIAGSIDYVRNMTIFISVTALIIAVVLTYWAASSIVKRIAKLRQAMVMTQIKNDFKFRAQIDGHDEVTDLSLSFNNLLGHLEQSVSDLAETRVQQHKAVVSALQSQINSHFLYNTLESINSMAVIYRQPDIGNVAVALSHMLRYTSDYKEWEVSLADEVRYTEQYLAIMKIRYGDDLSYTIDIPKEIRHVCCSKALLQPIVENSIKHTRETTAESVDIHISAAIVNASTLILSVRDNGKGFSADVLSRLRGELASDHRHPRYDYTGIGISNLIYRLHTFYAGDAQIMFDNDKGTGGAVVEVRLPMRTKRREWEI